MAVGFCRGSTEEGLQEAGTAVFFFSLETVDCHYDFLLQ